MRDELLGVFRVEEFRREHRLEDDRRVAVLAHGDDVFEQRRIAELAKAFGDADGGEANLWLLILELLPDERAIDGLESFKRPEGVDAREVVLMRARHLFQRGNDGTILFQIQKFLAMPEFEKVASTQAYESSSDAPEAVQLRLADGASADTIEWPNLGYADEYAKSFEIFEGLQRDGTIGAGVRFQVQYPTPLASMAGTVVPEDMQDVAASYERALFADLDDLFGRLPHDRIAVQWDVAVEFGVLEGAFGLTLPLGHVAPGLIRALDQVPADVPAGMHLCYGDYGHQHFTQPESLQMQVDVVKEPLGKDQALGQREHHPGDQQSG